ncbi:MAG: hypothetical protein E6I18_02785 [Chloroflexi bacterium]|nr:MAG: hypothetical protein E6I18_02785 [Chloroflexota bacterium]
MRPFRSRLMAAFVFAILLLGLLGNAANAADIPTTTSIFSEDPWDGATIPLFFPEDPWPGLTN